MRELTYAERPAIGEPDGLLILHHGRGADEQELLEHGAALDRVHRLHLVLPRAPLTLEGLDGHHWFAVRELGRPEPDSFQEGYAALCHFHDQTWERTGIGPERTVIAGFSMGAAISYATGLGRGRPRPAGIVAFSGVLPSVEGWEPELDARAGLPVLITHGRTDRSLEIEFAHRARLLLEQAGLEVSYQESAGGHEIDERAVGRGIQWLAEVL
jgi:phospholipase/carboxylesterase